MHRSVLVILVNRTSRRVYRQCLVVGVQAPAMRVRVAEHASLEHFVGREGHLLDLSKVPTRDAIRFQDTHCEQRELPLRSSLGQVEGVEASAAGPLFNRDMDAETAFGKVAAFDAVRTGIPAVVARVGFWLIHRFSLHIAAANLLAAPHLLKDTNLKA